MKRAIITGASSGIGREIALELSRRGWALALLARREDLLRDVAREVRESTIAACDVGDSDAVHDAVRRTSQTLGGPFDLAIANAGVGAPTHGANFPLADAETMVRVNILGMLYLFGAVVPAMIERKSGRFAGVASLAGHRGLPGTSIYSATKSFMQTFLEASRIELAPYGVGVTTINPGFIVTPMTEKNKFRMPFLMNADRAAKIIVDGLEWGVRVVEFPRVMSMLTRSMRLMPSALYDRMTGPFARRKMDDAKVKR
ncbi:MAG: SDR family NAD(P)-dependent oxidoreductase [Thermoanaerobaculia bacterium]